MTLATTQRNDDLDLRYYKVTDYGEAPASTALQSIRVNKITPKVNKKTVKSTILGTRQVEAIHKLGEDASLSFGGELAHGEWEFIFEAIMGAAFTTFTTTQTDISFAASDSSINSSADFGGVVAGQWIKVAGTASHNGLWFVAEKTSSSKLILSDGVSAAGVALTVVDESAGASMTVTGKHLRQGSTLNAYTFERKNTTNGTFDVINSVVFDTISLSLKGDAVVMLEASGNGKVADLNNGATFGSSVVAPSTAAPFNATANLIRIKEGSSVLTDEIISGDIAIKANQRQRTSLGNSTPTGAAQGVLEASGNVEFYFKDNVRRQAFQDHTDTPLHFILKDPSANFLVITVDRSYYQTMDNANEGMNADTLEKYSFEASKDETYAQTITVDVL